MSRAAHYGRLLAARARARCVAVEAEHLGRLVALAAPRRPGRLPRVRRWQLAGEIRAASTAYGLRTPLVFAPVKAANACGAQPVFSAVATVALLAARSPKLDTALRAAKQAGHAFVVMDGTLIPIDRVAADRPFYSGKHRKHGMNLQVIASPHGDIVWISGALPGSVHDLTAARIWSIVPRLAAAGLIVLAVRPGPRCGQRSVPGGLGAGAHGGPL